MGFAVRADQDRGHGDKGLRQQNQKGNLVLLHPVKSSGSPLSGSPSKSSPRPFSGSAVRAVSAPAAAPPPHAPAEVRQLPTSPRLPLGLKLLVGIQQGSTVVTGGLVATALVVYSWTVYLDKSVARSFQHLEALKVSTQQMTTANETLKHSMAQQAESPGAGFKPLEPEGAIFVSPAALRPSVEPEAPVEKRFSMPHPLGY